MVGVEDKDGKIGMWRRGKNRERKRRKERKWKKGMQGKNVESECSKGRENEERNRGRLDRKRKGEGIE